MTEIIRPGGDKKNPYPDGLVFATQADGTQSLIRRPKWWDGESANEAAARIAAEAAENGSEPMDLPRTAVIYK